MTRPQEEDFFAASDYPPAEEFSGSDLLIIRADFGMRAQHHRLEHVAHALFADRAPDHHDELRQETIRHLSRR